MFKMGYGSRMGQQGKAHEAINLRALELIREAFKDANITQETLAARSGVPRSTIANLLTETRTVNVDVFVRLARAFGGGKVTQWAAELEQLERTRQRRVGVGGAGQPVKRPDRQPRAPTPRTRSPRSGQR